MGPFWSKDNPSLTMISREENIEYSRNLVVPSKLRKRDPLCIADICGDIADSDQSSEEDYPETDAGKI